MTAYITGTSARKVDDLVKALGCESGISKSTVSRICTQIDADVHVLRTRRLDHQPFVYVWLDATYVHVRENRRVVSKAIVIATGLRQDGHREVLGLDVGDSENETFWKEFLGDLNDRGLAGVRLVISDAHAGLVKAIRRCFQNASWQRCRVHAMRNLLAAANHRHRQVIAALIRTIFVQPDTKTATAQLRAVVEQLRPYAPGVAERLEQMETDLLAYSSFPVAHWSKIWSNNPIERLNRELKRRTDVVGIFPDKASVIRLVGALLVEINDEMIAAERRYIAAASVADLTHQPAELSLPAAPRTGQPRTGRTRAPTPRAGTPSLRSTETVNDALESPVAKLTPASLQCELLDRHNWPTRVGLTQAMHHLVEVNSTPPNGSQLPATEADAITKARGGVGKSHKLPVMLGGTPTPPNASTAATA